MALTILANVVKEGGSKQVSQDESLLKSIIKHFNKLAYTLSEETDEMDESKLQYRMFSTLSLIVQIIHENKGCRLPFNRRFFNNLFTISSDLIACS